MPSFDEVRNQFNGQISSLEAELVLVKEKFETAIKEAKDNEIMGLLRNITTRLSALETKVETLLPNEEDSSPKPSGLRRT